MDIASVREALSPVIDPVTGKSLTAVFGSVGIVDGAIELYLDYPAERRAQEVGDAAMAALAAAGIDAELRIVQRIQAHGAKLGLKVRPGVRNMIAVSSCKGGVGKSTVAANLALALARDGARVGIFDADIHGPSLPTMLGFGKEPPMSRDGRTVLPYFVHGLQAMSVGVLLERDDEPLIMRGPMLSSTMQQLLDETAWQDLDYLVIDMPPGTGDIQLTLAQSVPITGAVIVTTPQELALLDVRKGLRMFEKLHVPVLGVVENMAGFVCPCCGHFEPIFGEGGAEALAKQYRTQVLGRVPIATRIRTDSETGSPTVEAEPDGAIADAYRQISERVAAALAQRDKDHSLRMPTIQTALD